MFFGGANQSELFAELKLFYVRDQKVFLVNYVNYQIQWSSLLGLVEMYKCDFVFQIILSKYFN